MIIDGTNLVLGRLASFAAKQALLGEKIEIVNSREVVIIGDKKVILEKYLAKKHRGNPSFGPFFPLRSDRILRRTIRNMLPFRAYKGKKALAKIRCYIDVPEKMNKEEMQTVETAKLKDKTLKYLKLKDLSRLIGNKQ